MARAAAKFREADVKRAIKAALAAGLKLAEVNIANDGSIKIVPVDADTGDTELANFRRRNGYS